MAKVVLIGAGGHGKVIQDIVRANDELNLYAVLDQDFKQKRVVDKVTYGHTDSITEYLKDDCYFCVAIGDNKVREKLVNQFSIPTDRYITLIHPSAAVSPKSAIGMGTVIMPNAIVNADTVIGNHSIINSGAVIEHDNNLLDFVHVSPNATLAGTVSIGEGTHIGSGATIIPGINIGNWSVVGAGGVVVNNIEDDITVVGVPAKKI